MRAEWIVHEGASGLLFFFNGWGMERRTADHLVSAWGAPEGADLVLLYDYSDLSLPDWLREAMHEADTIDIMAWSLGVWAASSAGLDRVDRAVAINGTLFPVDAERGIPPEIFRGTLEQWDDSARRRFERRMFAGVPPPAAEAAASVRSSAEQKEELGSIEAAIASAQEGQQAIWRYSRVITGGRDLIFSPENQRRAWPEMTPVTLLDDMPHFPFFHLKGWREVFP